MGIASGQRPEEVGPRPPRRDAYAALRRRDFRYFLLGHVTATAGTQMQNVAVGWQLYERTDSAFALGLLGLVQIVPMLAMALPAGHLADRYDRRRILIAALVLRAISSLGLALVVTSGARVSSIYGCLFLSGLARAFQGPARGALLPGLVPRSDFANAVTWNASGFEMASLAGPATGGLLIALTGSAMPAYLLCALADLIFAALLALVPSPPVAPAGGRPSFRSLGTGLRFVLDSPLLLAALTLDLFAVLLGGAVALLPVYARDILRVGPVGLGWMQAAPSLGALLMALLTTHLPPLRRAGRTLLLSVAGFGVATIIFGLTRSFGVALLMLFLTGAFDNISVVIRHTLVQILTPDELRGRVSAVNGMFISASNELGRFESGAVAGLFSPTVSVVGGGIGTLLVVAAVARRWPQLRDYGPLEGGSH
jgi:MFS family permease